jgi:hypothetical protein
MPSCANRPAPIPLHLSLASEPSSRYLHPTHGRSGYLLLTGVTGKGKAPWPFSDDPTRSRVNTVGTGTQSADT